MQNFPAWTLPAALLALALFTFAPLITRQGFYWDDWPQLFAYRGFGASGFWSYFASDRPLSAWTHVLFSPLLGGSSIGWKLFTLGLRWLAAVAAWWLFNEVWPRYRWQAGMAAAIFLVYPSFSQQPISVAYHQHWLQYALFLLSLAAMVHARRVSKHSLVFTGLAILAQLLQLSITEFFVGSELLRPVLLWMGAEPKPGRWKRALLGWLPYLAVLAVYTVWRLVLLRFAGHDPNQPTLLYDLFHNLPATLAKGLTFAFWDSIFTVLSHWARVLSITAEQAAEPFTMIAWLAGLTATAVVTVYLSRVERCTEDAASPRWPAQAAIVGALALFLGPLPVWALGTTVLTDPDPYHADRYTLAAMLGAALLFAALIDWAGRARIQKALLAGLAIGLAVSFQLRTANDYRWLWIQQQRTYWQLAWRAPALKPDTALLAEQVMFPFQGNFATGSALNLLYPQSHLPERVDYWVYALRPRFENRPTGGQTTAGLSTNMRTLHFSGSTEHSLLVDYDNRMQGCLWVLTSDDADNPYLSDLVKAWLPASHLEQISSEAPPDGYPPVQIFGREPEHEWCYYFEKAELAAQMQDWTGVVALAEEARAKGYDPSSPPSNSPREWLAFIRGYAHSQQPAVAHELTLSAVKTDPAYGPMLCKTWQELPSSKEARQVREELGCAVEP